MSYSIVCKRCGRKLRSEASRNRGYGSYCYRKIANDEKRDNLNVEESDLNVEESDLAEQIEQIDGQIDIDEVLKQVSGM